MIKITANSSENFTKIETSLAKLDPDNIFLTYFNSAEEMTDSAEDDKVAVVLKNSVKFPKDLNQQKFIVTLPKTLVIDSFDYVTEYENTTKCGCPPFPPPYPGGPLCPPPVITPGMPPEIRTNKPNRKATYSVVIKCHIKDDETVDYVFVLAGFNDQAIRIILDEE